MTDPLAIVDPALGATGAHNAGLASLIAHRYPDALGSVAFWGSARTVPDSVLARVDTGVELHPLFHTDFFALIKQGGAAAEHWPWIRQLSAEYLRALEQIAVRWPNQRVRVLHHTLSWEHASALTLALRLRGAAFPNQLHLCFLMYSPGVDRDGSTIDGARRVRFTQAFRFLSQLSNVRLFAACSEYADAYRHLLELPHAPPLHPCFLVEGRSQNDLSRRPPRTREKSGFRRSILYMGVIKKEKGFFRLPDLLDDLRDQGGRDDELIIQFVRSPKIGPKVEQIIAHLQTIAASDPRVWIHDKFWDEITLSEQVAQSDRLFLDYDPEAYRHKTSGLLWLGAWHDLQIVLPRETWLEREAVRLGVDWIAREGTSKTVRPEASEAIFDPTYRTTLFRPFLPWVMQQTKIPQHQHLTSRLA